MLLRRWMTSLFSCEAGDNIHAGENAQSRRKHTGAADGEGSWEGGRERVAGGREGGHRFWERLVGRRVSGSGSSILNSLAAQLSPHHCGSYVE